MQLEVVETIIGGGSLSAYLLLKIFLHPQAVGMQKLWAFGLAPTSHLVKLPLPHIFLESLLWIKLTVSETTCKLPSRVLVCISFGFFLSPELSTRFEHPIKVTCIRFWQARRYLSSLSWKYPFLFLLWRNNWNWLMVERSSRTRNLLRALVYCIS